MSNRVQDRTHNPNGGRQWPGGNGRHDSSGRERRGCPTDGGLEQAEVAWGDDRGTQNEDRYGHEEGRRNK